MSALYFMRYLGATGIGAGVLYIGKGIIAGADIIGGIYDGTYAQEGERLRGNLTMRLPQGGVLVTGQVIPPDTPLPITCDLPTNFANGQAQAFNVGGRIVNVTFQKIRDIP